MECGQPLDLGISARAECGARLRNQRHQRRVSAISFRPECQQHEVGRGPALTTESICTPRLETLARHDHQLQMCTEPTPRYRTVQTWTPRDRGTGPHTNRRDYSLKPPC